MNPDEPYNGEERRKNLGMVFNGAAQAWAEELERKNREHNEKLHEHMHETLKAHSEELQKMFFKRAFYWLASAVIVIVTAVWGASWIMAQTDFRMAQLETADSYVASRLREIDSRLRGIESRLPSLTLGIPKGWHDYEDDGR